MRLECRRAVREGVRERAVVEGTCDHGRVPDGKHGPRGLQEARPAAGRRRGECSRCGCPPGCPRAGTGCGSEGSATFSPRGPVRLGRERHGVGGRLLRCWPDCFTVSQPGPPRRRSPRRRVRWRHRFLRVRHGSPSRDHARQKLRRDRRRRRRRAGSLDCGRLRNRSTPVRLWSRGQGRLRPDPCPPLPRWRRSLRAARGLQVLTRRSG